MDDTILDQYIIGRVEPQIYAFTTGTVPNYLKVGDTYRPIDQRLTEWRKYFPDLEKQYAAISKVDDEIYFRDFAVHYFLEHERHYHRLLPTDIKNLPYYSKEFFEYATGKDVAEAIRDIKEDFESNQGKYQFYTFKERPTKMTFTYKRGNQLLELRPNQKETVANFTKAVKKGRGNLLMYAVMRFGKTFTALSCASSCNKYKTILVVSGKADVKMEWKKTVEGIKNFEGFDFIDSLMLARNPQAVSDALKKGRRPVVFLTLQDLSGEKMKVKHQDIFSRRWDMLIIDETHYGARAEEYGKVLRGSKKELKGEMKYTDSSDDYENNEELKILQAQVRIHLSGTPYRILMGSEFQKEDIIAFYQFSDIVKDKEKWDAEYLDKDEYNEWDNPYYGFPQMIRFAFQVNESSMKRLEEMKKNKVEYALNELLRPKSTIKDPNGLHRKFVYEKEVLDLFMAIDGSKEDSNLLGFLDDERIKKGKLCHHIVCVLPYRASCDAMESLIMEHLADFKNLAQYEILNITGVENEGLYRDVRDVKDKIDDLDRQGKKTITLTVNRMLTGTTVEQWDTMIYLKDTASPQEYDQSIFRLQNQYIREYKDKDGHIIKYNMKPQTLLVDFEPGRMFRMQEAKAQIYNVNTDKKGNAKLSDRIAEELRISPIIMVNKDKMREVEPNDILEAVNAYSANKSIMDEATDIPVDAELLSNDDILEALKSLYPIDAKMGIRMQGEFANALFKVYGDKVRKSLYSLPTSPLTYEFTRKVYALLGMPVSHVIENFNTYDLLNNKKKEILMNSLKELDFSIVIGNPPYQDNAVGEQKTYNGPLYNKFLDSAYEMAGFVEMIHPARFLTNAGSTPKEWNKKMLGDPHLAILKFWGKSIFDNTEIKGGLAISVRDDAVHKGPIGLFTPYQELNTIIQTVINRKDFKSMSDIVVSRTAYRFTNKMHEDHPEALAQLSNGHPYDVSTNIFERLPQVFFDEKPDDGNDYIRILGRMDNARVLKYVRRDYIRVVENLDDYKVFLSKANGTGELGETLTPPIVGNPGVGNTETFISIGKFATIGEAEALCKYIATKFARALLGALKTTQDITPEKWKFVPQQDFSDQSDIDWSLSIDEINSLLYDKYHLSEKERAFIDEKVQAMKAMG